jgi:tetratricopeptide (TPR) repeat protein
LQRKAALGDLREALTRLAASESDGELVALAKECLAAEAEDRPRDAGAVAARLRSYLASIDERMHQARLAEAAATARAEEAKQTAVAAEGRARAERQARWLTAGLAAAVLALALVGAGGSLGMQQQRARRLAATARAVNEALDQATRLEGEARAAAGDDLAKWSAALAQVERAGDLVKQGEADATLRGRIAAVRTEMERGRAVVEEHARQSEADRRLLESLEMVRARRADEWDTERADAAYAAAFRAAGLDVDATEPKQAGAWIAARTAPIEITAFLDDWALVRWETPAPEPTWRRLVATARAADPDPWRDVLRANFASRGGAATEAFRRLADETKALEGQPAASLVLLAQQLKKVVRDNARAEWVLRDAWHQHPGDFWINLHLARVRGLDGPTVWEQYPNPGESIVFLSAAVAARPHSFRAHDARSAVLFIQGKYDESIAELRQALRLQPENTHARVNLGYCEALRGRPEEGIAELRKVLRLNANYSYAHSMLGAILMMQGSLDEAVAEERIALRLDPRSAVAHTYLGTALRQQGRLDEAIAEHREALRLNPSFGLAQQFLGIALRDRRGIEQTVVARARYLIDLGRRAQADAELAKAREKWPDDLSVLKECGSVETLMGRLDQGTADFNRALAMVVSLPAGSNPWSSDDPAGVYPEAVSHPEVFERLVHLRPDDQTLFIARVRHHARRREWLEAAATAARLSALESADHWSWHNEVALRSYLGNSDGSRRVCQRMLERFGSTTDAKIARRTLQCCLLEPNAVPDVGVLKPLHECNMGSEFAGSDPWSLLAAGFYDYRLGNSTGAIERLGAISGKKVTDPRYEACWAIACVVEAMAHQKSAQTDEARRLLARAEELARRSGFDPERAGPLPTSWHDWLRYHVLHREAEGLIHGAAFPDDPFAR